MDPKLRDALKAKHDLVDGIMREYATELEVQMDRAIELGWDPGRLMTQSSGQGDAWLAVLDDNHHVVAKLAEVRLEVREDEIVIITKVPSPFPEPPAEYAKLSLIAV